MQRKITVHLTMFCVILFIVSPFTAAQTDGPDPFRPGGNTRRSGNMITNLEVVDADVTVAFRMISDLTGWSIVMSEEISSRQNAPKVNLWIKHMPPDEVLQEVARLAGLVVERKGNVVHVMSFNDYTRLYGVERRVIPIQHVAAQAMVDTLRPFVQEKRGQVLADQTGSKLVLLAPEPLMESLLRLIAALDTPFEQDMIRVIKVKHLEAESLVPDLEQFLTRAAGSQQSRTLQVLPKLNTNASGSDQETIRAGDSWLVQFMVEPKLNSIVLRGRPAEVQRAIELIEALDQDPQIHVKSHPLRFTNAQEAYITITEIIENEQSGGGRTGRGGENRQTRPRLRVAASVQNNRLIVEGTDADHAYVYRLIDSIDQPLPAGSGGTRVYRLENASAAEVAAVIRALIESQQTMAARADTPSFQSRSTQAPPGSSEPGASSSDAAGAAMGGSTITSQVTEAPEINAIIIRASAAEHEEFSAIIQEMDRPRDQVMLEVMLVTVRSTTGFNLGVEIGAGDVSNRARQVVFSNFGIGRPDSATGEIRIDAPAPFGLNYGFFPSNDLSLVINALQTAGDTRIESIPKILVQDNAPALMQQLNEEPFSQTSQGESSTVTSFGGFVEAGTSLQVVPHISEDDWLRLDYVITLSSFGNRTAEQAAANLPPPRLQNQIEGVVRIPSDYTVVLGGLTGKRRDEITDQIPFLGDIPILGEIFKNRDNDTLDETLFIFIRPVILRDPGFADLLYLSEADVHKALLSRQSQLVNPMKLLTPSDLQLQEDKP